MRQPYGSTRDEKTMSLLSHSHCTKPVDLMKTQQVHSNSSTNRIIRGMSIRLKVWIRRQMQRIMHGMRGR